jgi:hypothetical protein
MIDDLKVVNDDSDDDDDTIGVYTHTKTKGLSNFLSSDLSKNQHENTPIDPQSIVTIVIIVIENTSIKLVQSRPNPCFSTRVETCLFYIPLPCYLAFLACFSEFTRKS